MHKNYEYTSPSDLLLGNSDLMAGLREKIKKLARSTASVFIYGESGVGKELVARTIHATGSRSEAPFVPINCGAIPSELMESEFFGHSKGSFTGAVVNKQGLFVAAQGGTLFLDEIVDLPLSMQVKLLRAIQEKAVKPIGEWREIPIDVRILSASNKNLLDEIANGHFRPELYYRINVIELKIPSLKERIEDIPVLAGAILERLALAQKIKPLILAKSCLETLYSYNFPGNIRELENILERAMTLCTGNVIETEHLALNSSIYSSIVTLSSSINTTALNLNNMLMAYEKKLVLDTLEKTKWNKNASAKLLGLSLRSLRYRLKKLELD